MPWDPFKDGGAIADWDPFRDGGALADDEIDPKKKGYVRDKLTRFTRAAVETTGDAIAGVGSAAESSKRLLDLAQEKVGRSLGADERTIENLRRENAQADTNARVGPAVQAGGGAIRKLGEYYQPDPARDAELGSRVAAGAGSLPPVLASSLLGGIPAALTAGSMMGENARQDAQAHGATPNQQAAAFALNAPATAASEAMLGVPALLKSLPIQEGVNAVTRIIGQTAKSAAREGAQEAIEQVVGNVVAKDVVGYDPTRARTEGVTESALIGGLIGAPIGTIAQAAHELDTGKNVPESKQTLIAQQEQLLAGRRPAQMFPVGTEELPLPDGLKRVETPRGVFHFNPQIVTEDDILTASKAGRENDVLAMGPVSKADTDARAGAGEPRVAVTERTPEGTEVKTVSATGGTAPAIAASLEASKTPKNTVQTEPIGKAVAQRPDFVADMMKMDAEKNRAAEESQAAERATRENRQKELDAKKTRFDETVQAARSIAQDREATFPAVNGALQAVRFYAEDNSVGLTEPQRDQARRATAVLEQMVAKIKPLWDAQKSQEQAKAEADQLATTTAQKAARTGARKDFKAEVAAGVGATGTFDYESAPMPALEARATTGDQKAIDAIARRSETAEVNRGKGDPILKVLARLKLPSSDKTLSGELADLIREGMTPRQRMELLSGEPGSLDGLAESLRVDHGFSWIQTPSDVIDAVQRALRGEDVRADWANREEASLATGAKRTKAPVLTEQQAEREMTAIRKAFPDLTREYDIEVGLVEDAMRARGYQGQVPAGVQAAVLRLKAQRSLIVLGARAYRDRAKGAALLTHEVAHTYWNTLPDETRQQLRTLHARESADKTGPLYQDGKLKSELDFTEEQSDRGAQEWFAERIARLNEAWALGRIDRTEHSLLVRIAHQVREFLRRIWTSIAERQGVDPEGDLFVQEFRRFFSAGADAEIGRAAGTAYAQAQGLLELESPVGITLPDEIRNLTPRWQAKAIRFASALDKALYYAQGEGHTAVRDRIITSLSQQTGLTPGQIAALARTLRERIGTHARATADPTTIRLPELMSEDVAKLTGSKFARKRIDKSAKPPSQTRSTEGQAQFATGTDDESRKQYDSQRPEFDRLTARVDELKQQIADLVLSQEPDAEARGHELNAELQRTEAQAKTLYATLEELRSKWDKGIPELGTRVESLPKADRQAALIAELKRGRQMRDEGIKTGNEKATQHGTTLVRQATDRLDDEFPGWDKQRQTTNQGQRPATDAIATQPGPQPDDAEPSPFRPDEQPTMPVRKAVVAQAYGHSATPVPAWMSAARNVRDVFRGFAGPVPELPTFPAAWWNKTDQFIKKHGAHYYNRVKEYVAHLRAGNDAVQREAADQVAGIIRPLLSVKQRFSAKDYAQLQERQRQVRKNAADGKPAPAGVVAEIQALTSEMESHPYVLFNRLVQMLDFHWRGTNLKDSAENPIALPGGLNIEEVNAELARLSQRLEASPHADLIKAAIKKHMALVEATAEDLKRRDLLTSKELSNPYYFPHLVLETTRGGKTEEREFALERVRTGTKEAFRGYTIAPVGSIKPIETDYKNAMYFHLVQVGAHNWKSDGIRDYLRPYNIKEKVEARAKELSRQRDYTVAWEQAFNEEFGPDGYVIMGLKDDNPFGAITVDRNKLAERLGVLISSDDLQRQLKELGLKGVKLLPEDLRETIIQGNKEVWVVPARVADALRAIDRREQQTEHVTAEMLGTVNTWWKQWKLFMPQSHFRYEFGNIVTDLGKVWAASPSTFKFLGPATKDIREFWLGGPPSDDLRAAIKQGVLNTVTAQEVAKLSGLPQFREFETKADKAWSEFRSIASAPFANLTRIYGRGLLGRVSSTEESAFREAVFRYANFKASLAALRNGARPEYGGAYWKNVDAMIESAPGANDAETRKAGAISRATFGDYGDISETGQWLRDKLMSFYSWQEVNFKYNANLFRNLRDMVASGEMTKAAAGSAAAKSASTYGAGMTSKLLLPKTATGAIGRLLFIYAAAAAWNQSGDRDELEKLLSDEDRRRFHIILGEVGKGEDVSSDVTVRTLADGRKIALVYAPTALGDLMRWFAGQKFAHNMMGWMSGKTDFPTALSAWAKEIGPDVLNNLAGMLGPIFKGAYTKIAKKQPFPDIFDQRSIPAYDMRRVILGQITDEFTADSIERLVNKDYYGAKDLKTWAMQLILQVRQRDPDQYAYYEIRDKAADFYERMSGDEAGGGGSREKKHAQVLRNFRRAIFQGDPEKAVQFYLRLLDYGYTAEKFSAALRAQDPLDDLTKRDGMREWFVASLSEFDREQLQRAYKFYNRIAASRGREAVLFPRQAWGARGAQAYQQQPRIQELRQSMDRVGSMDEEERLQRADRALRDSLQRRR